MALNSPFSVRIEKNSIEDLDEKMAEHRRSIKEALADFRAKHRYARRPNWPAWFTEIAYRNRSSGAA